MSHILKTVWSFDVKFCTLTCRIRKCFQTKFYGPKFRNKKVIKWPNFEICLDFLKTCKLWSTYFGISGKPLRSNTSHPNIVVQSRKIKKLNFHDDSDFLEIGELWSTYFDVF